MPNRELTGAEKYRFGYQGQFAEEDEETGYNHFQLRLYDARLGRWLNPDPNKEFSSPYLAMGNNPVLIIDPDGGVTCCDEANPYQLNEVVVIGYRGKGNPRNDKTFMDKARLFAKEVGLQVLVFTLNSSATQANNNLAAGLMPMPDPTEFGDYELAALSGQLAGNLSSIIQGSGEILAAAGGEAITVGGATIPAVAVAVHGGMVVSGAFVKTKEDIDGFVQYFSKRKHNAGKSFRGGKQTKRDNYLKSKPKDFQKWFHRYYKNNDRTPNLSNSEIDKIFKEWEAMGKPSVK